VQNRSKYWIFFFLISITVIFIWDKIYLNERSFTLVFNAYLNSILIAVLAIIIVISASWLLSLLSSINNVLKQIVYFFMNQGILIPQVLIVLFGQTILNILIVSGHLNNSIEYMIYSSIILSFSLLSESLTFFINRIELLKERGFYESMTSLNIRKWRIVHFDILWDNSRKIIITKAVSLFATVFFIQVIVDFIISVGLSRDLSQFNFPPSLGTVLADTTSKEDLLYVQHIIKNPSLIKNLFYRHLQGISLVAMLFVTLLSMVKYSSEQLMRNKS
jgi:hypothetical protein